MHSARNSLLVAVILLAMSPSAKAAGVENDKDNCRDPAAADVVKCFSVESSMPDSPGLMIVGLGADDVVRPTTPRQLGAALTNGVDEGGNPVAGFAVDFAPYKLLAPATTRDSYVKSRWLLQPLWNSQFSAGVGKNTDASDKTLRIGYGVSTVLWRAKASDPVLNDKYQKCLRDHITMDLLNSDAPPTEAKSGSSFDLELAKCYADFAARSWNATAFTVGFAGSQISEDGGWNDGHRGASGTWASFSYGFDHLPDSVLQRRAELLVHWRELRHERVTDPANSGAFIEQDSSQYGLLLRTHGERMNFHAERTWARNKLPLQPADKTNKFAVGVEWKVADSAWIVIAFGGESGRDAGGDETTIRTGIKFGKLEKPLFAGT